eukprot:12913252-Prorocentrum_lima.AAC.1
MGKNRSRPNCTSIHKQRCCGVLQSQAPVKRLHGHVRAGVVGRDGEALVDLHGSGEEMFTRATCSRTAEN